MKCRNLWLFRRARYRVLRCHVQRNRANAVPVFFYQVIKSLRVACCGDESIAGFEYSLRNVSAQTARAAGDQPYFVHKFLPFFFALIAWFQIVGALPSTGRVSSPPTFGKLDRKNSNPRSRAEMPLPCHPSPA